MRYLTALQPHQNYLPLQEGHNPRFRSFLTVGLLQRAHILVLLPKISSLIMVRTDFLATSLPHKNAVLCLELVPDPTMNFPRRVLEFHGSSQAGTSDSGYRDLPPWRL